jgi:hypothetical protein
MYSLGYKFKKIFITVKEFCYKMNQNGVVSLVADYRRFNFQNVAYFMHATNVEITTGPAIKFNTCYLLGF